VFAPPPIHVDPAPIFKLSCVRARAPAIRRVPGPSSKAGRG